VRPADFADFCGLSEEKSEPLVRDQRQQQPSTILTNCNSLKSLKNFEMVFEITDLDGPGAGWE